MNQKKFLLFSVFMIFMLIVGCSNNSTSESPSNKTAAPSNNKEPANSQGADDSEVVELTYVIQGDGERMIPVVEAFEEANPNIKVNLEPYPFRQLFETIEVKLGSKSTDIDIIDVDVPLVANYTVKGFLEPLDNYLGPDVRAKYIESAIEAGSYNGEFMAPPLNTSTQLLYYNKDIFDKKGIEYPSFEIEDRMTWEETVQIAEQLTYDETGDGQTDVFGLSFHQISRPYQMLALPQSLGAQVISDNGIVSTGYTNSPEMIQAGQFYYDLFNTWNISPKIPVEQSTEYFSTGKIAMFISGPWAVASSEEAGLNYGVAPHPYFEGGKAVTGTGSWHIGISKFSTKKEAAAKFIEFATAGEGSRIWFEVGKNLPANVDLLTEIMEDPSYEEFPKNVQRLGAYEASNTAVPRPLTPGYLEWETVVNRAFEDIKNGADPKTTFDGAVVEIDRLLQKYASLVE
jgi:ABC-type glycerol-3-phosphate transport system substrate-binding protein